MNNHGRLTRNSGCPNIAILNGRDRVETKVTADNGANGVGVRGLVLRETEGFGDLKSYGSRSASRPVLVLSLCVRTLPLELVEIIVREVWSSESPSSVRKSLIYPCSQINIGYVQNLLLNSI